MFSAEPPSGGTKKPGGCWPLPLEWDSRRPEAIWALVKNWWSGTPLRKVREPPKVWRLVGDGGPPWRLLPWRSSPQERLPSPRVRKRGRWSRRLPPSPKTPPSKRGCPEGSACTLRARASPATHHACPESLEASLGPGHPKNWYLTVQQPELMGRRMKPSPKTHGIESSGVIPPLWTTALMADSSSSMWSRHPGITPSPWIRPTSIRGDRRSRSP